MQFNIREIRNYLPRLSLNKKLVALMLVQSLSIISILVFLHYQTGKSIYNEFEEQIADLSKGIQMGVKEVTSSGFPEEKHLQNYLSRLQTSGVREISIISNSDKILASTDPQKAGKWITKAKKELIFKAELGEPVIGEGQFYNVIVPVVAGDKHYGYINLTVNTEDFSARMQKRLTRRIIAAMIIFGIGIIISIILAKRYTKPIEDVVLAARNVAHGNLNQEIHTARRDEIGELAKSFNYMVGKLKEERVLEERLHKAEQLAGIGQFSMSIAHEIKNPLNFISLSIDHIQHKYVPPEEDRKERFDSLILNIKNEIQRVSGFAESLLEYRKHLKLDLQRTDVKKLIEDVLELVKAKAEKEKIEIIRELDILPEPCLDSGFIKTCLYNILLNAFHAMPGGGRITVRASSTDGKLVIAIEDTGVGMSAEKISKIFDPFFTTKQDGLGIGLTLTKSVVEQHKGRIEFTSIEGKGSTITLFLPLEKET
ncbi:MAG: HAMP domain-containing sensor histidine kinase [Nitrospirales bacterium]|nr:MAG: HAMP domain-containing sensor histidine kinase [Nitrospirales bacterium]